MPHSIRFELRPGRGLDARGIARVEIEAWRDAYAGLLPDQALVRLNPRQSALGWSRTIAGLCPPGRLDVALSSAALVGFCYGGPARRLQSPGRRRIAEIYALYVDPNVQGCGIGTALVFQAARAFHEAGFSSVSLSMLHGNRIGKRFYEYLGGHAEGELLSVVFGTPCRQVLYHWPDIEQMIKRLETVRGDQAAG